MQIATYSSVQTGYIAIVIMTMCHSTHDPSASFTVEIKIKRDFGCFCLLAQAIVMHDHELPSFTVYFSCAGHGLFSDFPVGLLLS